MPPPPPALAQAPIQQGAGRMRNGDSGDAVGRNSGAREVGSGSDAIFNAERSSLPDPTTAEEFRRMSLEGEIL